MKDIVEIINDNQEFLRIYNNQKEEIERLNNIIDNAKDNIEDLKDRAKEVSWVEMRSEVYCEELDSIFELRGDKE